MIFRNFSGSETVKKQIACLIESGRLPHAIVLEGSQESGVLLLARELAAALVCTGRAEHPCGQCPACKKMAVASHPDVFEYVAKDTPRSFPVSVVREVRSDAYIVPNEADYKVYILGNASSMGGEAQNALLKTLEEPPANVVLILTVPSKTLLLATVLSRSTVFTLEEQAKSYEEPITLAAEKMGQALARGNEYGLLIAAATQEGSRDGIRSLSEALNDLFRASLLHNAGGISATPVSSVSLQLSQVFSKKQLLSLLAAVEEIRNDLNRNANNTLVLTRLCYLLKQAAF